MSVAAGAASEIGTVSERQPDIRLSVGDRVGLAIAALSAVIAIGVLISGLALALGWYAQPFPGVFVYPNGVVVGTRPLFDATWNGLEAGLQADDRLLTLNGASLVPADDAEQAGVLLNQRLSALAVDDVVTFEVLRPAARIGASIPDACTAADADGAVCRFTFSLMTMPLSDFLGHFGIGYVTALIGVGLGVWLLRERWQEPVARLLAVLCMAGAVVFVARFETITTYQMALVMILGLCVLTGILLLIAFTFPYPLAILRRQPWLRPVLIASPLILFIAYLGIGQLFGALDVAILFVALCLILTTTFLVSSMLFRRNRASSSSIREQASVAVLGALVPLLPVLVWWLTNLIENVQGIQGLSFSTVWLQPPALVFPVALIYAISARSILDSDRMVSEGLILSVMGIMLVLGFMLLTGAAYALTAGVIQPNHPLLIGLTLFVVAVMFMPLRIRLERLVEDTFFKQRRLYERRLERFATAMTMTIETSDVVKQVKAELAETLRPQYMFIFLRNPISGEFEAVPDPDTGEPMTDVRFRPDGGLLRLLGSAQTVMDMDRANIAPTELQADRARLAVLNTPVIARLRSVRRFNGFMALGPRADRSPYTHEDLRFLERLANQAAAAFERALVVLESQRNERELQVLVQVGQALNIAMDFDILLEFVYAQVDKVISAPHFYIALRDPKSEELSYVFYQEYGERITEKEGERWPMGGDLMSEVVRTQQPIRTDNYVRDMQRRDSANRIENTALRAWLGIPLNASDQQTLGCLVVASTDPTVVYTEDQTRILWSIADLAATAIYKTRLYSETAELARQMKILNDISSSLGTLFEDLDALLQRITESAVSILNGEAGSLLLVDENTGELVFRHAVGGAGESVVGNRIPPGSGIVGMVVMTGRHLIVNDASRDPRWYGEVSASGDGFTTSAILAVPLSARGRVIGVLEVINKQGGSGFEESDASLLTAFASQAAIAIENANLFRLTDEALAERVRQLFNMQRIDQELNRTLDLQRVVDLTVDNAIRESDADAGALALVTNDPPSFHVMGCAGYPESILQTGDHFALNYGILGRVYESSLPLLTYRKSGSDPEFDALTILPGAVNQLCVPLITGERVTGLLLLESTVPEMFSSMTAEHIQALAEHANTAITNAQLFSRLGEANEARIKFVSIVAHELKQPITSIKGYSEVLLGGAAGSLNDRQSDFLSTIRRNSVRVQQLIEDLRDITAQETGNLKLKLEPISFNHVMLESVRPQQRAFDEKDQKIALRVSEDLPRVWADENRLIQIMTNFLSNANKYTPAGGTITVTAEHTPNYWDPDGAPEVIHCTITDTGIGMSEEDLRSLFKAYWRSSNPQAAEQPGTGLGMSLTRGLIEAHGGRVWVESRLGEGSTFHFTIPLAPQSEAETAR